MSIYWFCPDTVMQDFKDPLDNPSFRLRCWYIHERLVQEGYNSKIVNKAQDIVDPSILILMSFGEQEYEITKWVKNKGAKVLHDYSENIRGIPILEQTKQLCDYLVCCSTYLARIEGQTYGNKAVVIKDPIENFNAIKNFNYTPSNTKVVWSGMGGNADLPYNILKPVIENEGMEYIEISNRKEANITWSRTTWLNNMLQGDICICPVAHWQFPAKSNIKVTTAMSLGLPVLASPLESYTEIIHNGKNGFICHTLEDWTHYLQVLKIASVRNEIRNNAFKSLESYKLDNIYKQWKNLFNL